MEYQQNEYFIMKKFKDWIEEIERESEGFYASFNPNIGPEWEDLDIVKYDLYSNDIDVLCKARGYCEKYCIITNGKRFYIASLWEFYNRRGNIIRNVAIKWDKFYGLTTEEKEAKKKILNDNFNKRNSKKKPFDFSYLQSDEWLLYADTIRQSTDFDEANDCTVVSVACVANQKYKKIHKLFEEYGRQSREGCCFETQKKVVSKLGLKMIDCSKFDRSYYFAERHKIRSRSYSLKGITKHLDPKKKYLIYTNCHVLACVNNILLDFNRNRRILVKYVVEVREK